MMKTTFQRRIFGILIFAIGVLSSTVLTGGLTWAGLESAFYGFPRYTEERFDGLSCPPLMTRSETASVRVIVNNPSKWEISPIMTIDISAPGLPDSEKVQVKVPAGQTRQLEWSIPSANVDRYYFIFVKANRSASYPLLEAEALCGILVLDFPFLNGMQILSIWLTLSVAATPLGLWMWRSGLNQPDRLPSVATALAVTSLGSLLASLHGIWMLGIVFLVVIILMTLGLLRR